MGDVVPSVDPNILLYTKRVPIGVVSLITPWNFPLAIPIWKMAPALVYGNTIVLKPASATPRLGVLIAEMWDAVGLPPGVFNLITGSGGAVGDALVSSAGVSAVSFTGSTSIGMGIAAKAASSGVKYQLEMGGKNPVIVMPDADLEQAAQVTVDGAMKYSGQKCTATSRAIVIGNVIEDFTDLVVEKTEALAVGPGAQEASVIVPVIDEASRQNIVAIGGPWRERWGERADGRWGARGWRVRQRGRMCSRQCCRRFRRTTSLPVRRYSAPCSA